MRDCVGGTVSPSAEGAGEERRPPSFAELYAVLRAEYGAGSRWPAESDFEIMVGAVLVQGTAWGNVLASVERLRSSRALEPAVLIGLEEKVLQDLVRPSGFMTRKSRTLRGLAAWLLDEEGARERGDEELRSSLLGLRGIGPETADVIILYVYDRARFIWDTYGRRMLSAVGYEVARDYEGTRHLLEAAVAREGLGAAEHQELHWLVLEAGRDARAKGGWAAHAARLGLTCGTWQTSGA